MRKSMNCDTRRTETLADNTCIRMTCQWNFSNIFAIDEENAVKVQKAVSNLFDNFLWVDRCI